MSKMDIGRISIKPKADSLFVRYDAQGKAYCDPKETHQWQTGKELFNKWDRPRGYVGFGDRNLGGGVQHKVAIGKGETYEEFWTRVKAAERTGYIETIGSSAYSAKDMDILKNIGVHDVEKKSVDSDALRGMSVVVGSETIYPYGKHDTDKPGIMGKISSGVAGLSLLGVMCLMVVAYLVLRRK